MTAIGNWTWEQILYSIECGDFAEYDATMQQEFYDRERNRNVVVTMRNNGFELAELSVEITDEENEYELASELYASLEFKAEKALLEADKEAREEGEYRRQLWMAV